MDIPQRNDISDRGIKPSQSEADTNFNDRAYKESSVDVYALFQELDKKCSDGNYIYRGEAKDFGEISSSLYRHEPEKRSPRGRDEKKIIDIEYAEKRILKDLHDHTGGDFKTEHKKEDTFIQLQHLGGKSNYIDFTSDYRIALFFACSNLFGEDARILAVKKSSTKNYAVIEPTKALNERIISQKSVFVRPEKGYLDTTEDNIKVHEIKATDKGAILHYLEKYCDISSKTLFCDMQGYIAFGAVYDDYQRALLNGKHYYAIGEWAKAIGECTIAIDLKPDYAEAYYNRGLAYEESGKFTEAIADFNKAIELESGYAEAHNNGGIAYGNE